MACEMGCNMCLTDLGHFGFVNEINQESDESICKVCDVIFPPLTRFRVTMNLSSFQDGFT